jgi:intracellular multiplication protein IcmT
MNPDAHWRDSARSPKLFVLDYRAAFPFLYLMVVPSKSSFVIAFIGVMIFAALQYYGFTITVFFRWFRASFLAGRYKKASPWWLRDSL